VSYTFGKPDSLQGYLDGKAVRGTWDMGGPSADAPVVDNDELWIGSSMGSSPGSTLQGRIDEVAIYRSALPAERIAARAKIDDAHPIAPPVKLPAPPVGEILVQIFENVAEPDQPPTGDPALEFTVPAMAFVDLPRKYNDKGLIEDWQQPILVRAITRVASAAGEQRVLLRAKDAARLSIDGKVVAQTARLNKNASGHERVPTLAEAETSDLRATPPGHQEKLATIKRDGKPHLVLLEAIVGSQGLRPEIGELTVALAAPDRSFQLVTPGAALPLTDDVWLAYAAEQQAFIAELNRQQRAVRGAEEAAYWQQRHELAREISAQREPIAVPPATSGLEANNEIDHFINAKLLAEKLTPAPPSEDWEFARRATLDIVGTNPTPAELDRFARSSAKSRRDELIDRLHDDARWADHWTSYWQDVLAENPNILKGKLNNTGPFRTWIYESLVDNKPIDRFATELVAMEGSTWLGGVGGFALATENDAPLAAKAHVVCKAFLAVEMKCARCHDAPYHNISQQDAFSVAAMMGRGPQKIPKTSVVPIVEGARKPEVTISLAPGQSIEPQWPFTEIASPTLPDGLLRNTGDQRERVAAIITSPQSDRFAQVIVNRVWSRLMGRGIVDPVDDWEDAKPSHRELLDWLARELVTHNYDVKHVSRLIMKSAAYQRQVQGDADLEPRKLFATPTRRRLSAEQIVDSLFLAAGKSFNAEALSMDPEGRRPASEMLNLGVPTRAWQFTSLSNERDRPALALPVSQSLVDVLTTFGWRESRPDPITQRVEEPTLLQPAVLANGTVGRRITTLSDDSSFTLLALSAQSPEEFVAGAFERVLSRPPTSDEREMFAELLRDGFDNRVQEVTTPAHKSKSQRNAVSWSNHLSPEATKIKLELEAAARAGDPPTQRLGGDWRERAEDVVWVLVNSPEFMFVP
jgi:hypothetical protein